jgi:vancomycin resistance protein YoaR
LSVSKKVYIPLKEHDIISKEQDSYFIDFGHHGESIDNKKLLKEIEQNFQQFKSADIYLKVEKLLPKKLKVDSLYKIINKEPVDASFSIKNNVIKIIPDANGIKIEKEILETILAKSNNLENQQIQLPITVVQPKIKVQELNSKLFRDSLSYFSTQFYTGSVNNNNRKQNIIIAASKINGTVLGAGQIFSFNKVVGPRTPENGYKDAHAYIGGKIVDSTGGGICQVSTTLYNAILYADLNVVERHNHMFTVGYVPKGRDAAVAYGSSDFKFKNSTNMPIKIICSVSPDNKVHFSLLGTNSNPNKSVDFRQSIVKEIPFESENIEDPTIPIGQNQIIEQGMTGFVVDTYKITKENGSIVNEIKLHTSNYKPLSRQVKIGVKTETAPSIPVNQQQITKGVDDAYNPPINSQ